MAALSVSKITSFNCNLYSKSLKIFTHKLGSGSDTANYSRIESGKTDPAFSSVVKITKALGVQLTDLFNADEVLSDINSFDKSLIEKMSLVEQLDKRKNRLLCGFRCLPGKEKNERCFE